MRSPYILVHEMVLFDLNLKENRKENTPIGVHKKYQIILIELTVLDAGQTTGPCLKVYYAQMPKSSKAQ